MSSTSTTGGRKYPRSCTSSAWTEVMQIDDRNLIAKWKKPGYERLCCLGCIQPRDHNFAATCVCRVPKHLREANVVECVHCGCKGCASGD
ncbi:hypothetical protein HRI_003160900 [Hibiscus trionum]|uniref:Uncharacterized protein n=1 Tax=Hibiscus trionum TaxID=183268 RepID=A0A9W7IGY8_HIBTR|nr:hypothetical protein HRI_003160900 [Hibiscus trionum]